MKTIRESGKINIISNIGDGSGRRVANDFLNKLTVEFAKQSTKYINEVYEAPFAYKEKQLHSIIAPSIAKLTNAFIMECPVSRQWSKIRKQNYEDSHGWLDYWCRYRGVDFFIEIKHNYVSFKTINIRKNSHENWDYMNNRQLNLVKKEAKIYKDYSKGVLLISFHVITIYDYLQKRKKTKCFDDKERLIMAQKNYYENLKPSPNWSNLWILKNDLVRNSSEESKTHKTYYPGLIFISKVHEII